jgi:cobalamin biosynthesis protein CobD/CbiB
MVKVIPAVISVEPDFSLSQQSWNAHPFQDANALIARFGQKLYKLHDEWQLIHGTEMNPLISLMFVMFVLTATISVCESFSSKKMENGLLLGYILARKSPQFMPL